MGSSTKKIQKKIQKIMKEMGHDTPTIDNNITTIFNESIKLRKNKSFFTNDGFGNAIAGGVSIIGSISSGKMPKILEEIELLDKASNKDLATQEILNSILDSLEQDNKKFENELLLRAFKITMSELLLNKDLSICKFIELLVKKCMYLLLIEDTNEASLEEFGFIQTPKIQEKLEERSNYVVDKYLMDDIIKYSKKEIEFAVLVNSITNLKKSIANE